MRRYIVGVVAFLMGSTVVLAQPPRVVESGSSGKQKEASRLLEVVLPEVDWNPAQRGPLLAVVPKGVYVPGFSEPVFRNGEWTATPLPFPEKGPNGYRLNSLGERYGYRASSVGTLTVFAPTQMVVLNTRLPKPNLYKQLLPPEVMLQYFQSTLTPAQWRKFGSANGIGLSDLNPRQKEIFQALVPDPMQVMRTTRTEDSKRPFINEAIGLTAMQRASVRLHLFRKMDWYFRVGEVGTTAIQMSDTGSHTPNVSLWVRRDNTATEASTLFGAKVRESVPARPKPGHLPFDWNGLDAPVSLEDATTVGELIQRVREATRVELYVDRRYSDLPVFLRGVSARSGDVLRALALAVTGTYRKVGPAYVLTDDVVGLGTRHAQIAAWQRTAVGQAQEINAETNRALKDVSIAEYTGWEADDPLGPSPALSAQIEAHRKELTEKKFPAEALKGFDKRLPLVRVSEMSPTAQAMIKEQIESFQRSRASQINSDLPGIRTDQVVLNIRYSTRFLIPDVGAVDAFGGQEFFPRVMVDTGPEETRPPELVTPRALPEGVCVLAISPGSAEEAVQLVRAAKQRGFTSLWVHTGWDDLSLIAAAVKAGKEVGIPVGVAVRVLRSRKKTNLPADTNILGETSVAHAKRRLAEPDAIPGEFSFPEMLVLRRAEFQAAVSEGDWLRPDSPEVFTEVARRLKAISEIPGLAALALSDLSAPGYRCEFDAYSEKSGEEGWQLGYSEEMRLAFLREKGVDPVDLSLFRNGQLPLYNFPQNSRCDIQLPFFPDFGPTGRFMSWHFSENGVDTYDMGAKDAAEKWLEFRLEVKRQLVSDLVKQLKASAPQLPLYGRIGEDELPTSLPSGYALLGTPEQAANCVASRPDPRGQPGQFSSLEVIKRNTKQVLQIGALVPLPGVDKKAELQLQFASILSIRDPKWDGFVLDLTTLSAADALMLLETIQNSDAPKPGAK